VGRTRIGIGDLDSGSTSSLMLCLPISIRMTRRNKVLGIIGVVWGGGIVLQALTSGVTAPTSSYGTGAFVGFLFGVALLLAGSWTLAMRRRSG
jgi:hypothetical protein